ncbi:hypothetical protein V6N11_059200 [Hibiscus sabdariffa]|uniref:Uncharacterized protein n=1 Tax=Hibiscus sabdariffa TaxID=183260 RepID=A0ABR2U6P0_9ROSI
MGKPHLPDHKAIASFEGSSDLTAPEDELTLVSESRTLQRLIEAAIGVTLSFHTEPGSELPLRDSSPPHECSPQPSSCTTAFFHGFAFTVELGPVPPHALLTADAPPL